MSGIRASCILFLLLAALPPSASAQEPAPAPVAPPPEVRQLVDILRKPEMQAWLGQSTPPAAPGPTVVDDVEGTGKNLARAFRLWIADTRSHLAAIRDNSTRFRPLTFLPAS